MYFDSTSLIALLSDPALAETSAAAIAGDWRRFTSPVAVIETIAALPALGPEAVEAFLDTHGIELRDMPPGHRLIEAAVAALGTGKATGALLDAACAAYYEAEVFTLPGAAQV
jgi:uncharacterized protein with PIN domain